jgi:threonylcarbamoyladenosine tRNA methylthiotransferase MtaB
MRESLNRKAMREAEKPEDAEIVIVNTCTVTGRTDQQVRQALRKLHRENPEARLVVTGCYAERDPEALAEIPGVDLVIGNADRDRVADILVADGFETTGRIIHSPLDAAQDCLIPPMTETGGRTRPFIKLQDGCDARCSYCIVPFVRGPGRGARPEDIIREIENLVRAGYQEIVLTGVNLGTYGRKMHPSVTLPQLLRRILSNKEIGRLRLSSIEPMRFSREIIQIASEEPRFAPHFHIPLQSGSDRILKLMRRPYRSARFLDLLSEINGILPDAGIGTDILVGFPGETEQDFEATCEIARRAPLTYMHVFPFSAREGTDAPGMGKPVPTSVIRERAKFLREISRDKNLEFRRRFLGKTVPALTLSKEEEMGQSVVLTENYIHASVPDARVAPNRLVDATIVKVDPGATYASIQ